jgi:hypothetical protein
MSFPLGTEMFQFPRFAFVPYEFRNKYFGSEIRNQLSVLRHRHLPTPDFRSLITDFWKWVSPFGDSRIKACSRLPMTYRSVPRPSSPLSAKASTEYPYGT